MPLLWVNQIKYLGIYMIGGKYFKVDTSTMRRNFFASVNGIRSNCPTASDITKPFLMCNALFVFYYVRRRKFKSSVFPV